MMVSAPRAMHMFMSMIMLFFNIQAMTEELIDDAIQLIILFSPHDHDVDLLPQMGEQRIGTLPKAVNCLGFSYLVKAIKQTGDELDMILLVVIHQMQIKQDVLLRIEKHISHRKERSSAFGILERFGKEEGCNI